MRSHLVRLILSIGLLIIAGLLIGLGLAEPAESHPWSGINATRPLVIAHQGGDGERPGNTLIAFDNAVEIGADVLEMDIHVTADGHVVVIHDRTIDRYTDATGAVREMTLAELKALDFAYHWPYDDSEEQPYRGQGITIPTLAEVFEAHPGMRYVIEIKPNETSAGEALCGVIRGYGMEERVLVPSFHDEVIKAFREQCPAVATALSGDEVLPFYVLQTLRLGLLYTPPGEALQVPEYQGNLRVISPHFVEAAHRRNMEVHPWTINERNDMERMVGYGVDGIITDYPSRLLGLLER